MEGAPNFGDHEEDEENKKGEDDQLEYTRVKIREAREENERLKTVLSRIAKDYKSLQTQFFDISQQPPGDAELVALSLGITAASSSTEKKETEGRCQSHDQTLSHAGGLTLGRQSLSPENHSTGFDGRKEEEAGDDALASKKARSEDDDEVAAVQKHVKRTRVSVRARCEGTTMSDGCQWRKYGQKVSKGNPCPRAYYRCTVGAGCPVRKQVQRCIEDMSILITTYEGTHNHSLPLAATAMASTTAAAASMLSSGPSPLRQSAFAPSSNQFFINTTPPNQIHSPSPSSHPTITLDLTSNHPSSSSNATPTAFNFASNNIANSIDTGSGSGSGSGSSMQYNYQSYWPQRAAASSVLNYAPAVAHPRSVLATDTLARAITLDPGFQSVLAAAITSYVGARGRVQGGAAVAVGPKRPSPSSPVDERKKE